MNAGLKVVKYGKWVTCYVCKKCGIHMSFETANSIGFGESVACSNCGNVGDIYIPHNMIGGRFCYTYVSPWWKLWECSQGYWEYNK